MVYSIAVTSNQGNRGHIHSLDLVRMHTSCTIHPWMEGVITVTGKPVIIPNYPVDASGKKIMKMPIYLFTPDRKMEVGLSGILMFY